MMSPGPGLGSPLLLVPGLCELGHLPGEVGQVGETLLQLSLQTGHLRLQGQDGLTGEIPSSGYQHKGVRHVCRSQESNLRSKRSTIQRDSLFLFRSYSVRCEMAHKQMAPFHLIPNCNQNKTGGR